MEEQGGPVRVGSERVGSERENKHSRLGIWSLVLAVVATILVVAAIVIGGVFFGQLLEGVDPQNPPDPQQLQRDFQESPAAAGLGLAFLGGLGALLLYFVGLVLGIAGLVQRRRKRLFAVLGTVLNGLVFVGIILLVVLSGVLSAVGGAA